MVKINLFGKTKDGEKVQTTRQSPYYNHEAYPDPTAFHALKDMIREDEQLEKQISDMIHVFKVICSMVGFEIIGRVHFRHKKSGKEFR